MSALKNETVLYDVKDGIATITMNRPHVKNAINLSMHEELYGAFEEAANDDDVLVILLTGKDSSFSSGADIKSIPVDQLATFDHGEYLRDTYNRLILLLEEINKPTIAHINGIAVGAGLSIALACDFRVAEQDAKLALSFFGIGLTPDAGASYFLPRIVGLGKALEISMGDLFSAEEALRNGLIHQIGNVSSLTTRLKQVPFPAYWWMKHNMKAGFHHSLKEVLELEVQGQRDAGNSKSHQQAISAFINKMK
ncbi:enoyl-CoA hydratase/isomerase family protein [Evansella tamaricis]|uniref:Enoyl-CoA hydratase/isomerase family protein n=1 Tax=Evansella tamaricis TaxID=2069301 RepID=A0ABS6JRF5_9BACI|nr:enoyl-CoA hydratase-related protein [Evansella tamaricis]MBU9714878.1 enoyl-CoA hydratase/isomerase family protein [Evansella tamaricis]